MSNPCGITHPDEYALDMDVVTSDVSPPPPLHLPPEDPLVQENSRHNPESKPPKKRAETWGQDEIRALIAFRGEIDCLFNTSKSNKHLWEQISMKMSHSGYGRSPTMCTDKWRNLLKEYKKVKTHDRPGSVKLPCYKDLEELLQQRPKAVAFKSAESSTHDSPKESNRSAVNLERRLDQEGHPLAIPSHDAVAVAMPSWSWREPMANGGDRATPYEGRVITVNFGNIVKRIGIDGTAAAIKEAIQSTFGLRSKRAFWLEDEDGVVRSLDREMPQRTYNVCLDKGLSIKICAHDENGNLIEPAEEKTFYTEDGFYEFLRRRGWSGLREVASFRDIYTFEELRPMCIYQRL